MKLTEYIRSFIRHALSTVGGSLIGYGVTDSMLNSFSDALAPIIAGFVMTLVAQIWSLVQAKLNQNRLDVLTFLLDNEEEGTA